MTRAAVLGSPIRHTLSPVLHRAAYAELGLDWGYDVIECDEHGLPVMLDALGGAPEHRYAGVSLTMPLKRAVLGLVDELAEGVELVGAANTVLFEPEGGRVGHNTDIAGLVDALAEVGVRAAPGVPVVLGGGGACRAALGALGRLGTETAVVCVRDLTRAAALVDVGERCGVAVVVQEWDTAEQAVRAADVVIAATPAGATDALADNGWSTETALVDVVYHPWPTALGAVAADAGAAVAGGLAMLVGQAAEAVTLMTGRPAPVAAMRAAGEIALAGRG